MGNRNAVMFAKKNKEPINLLHCRLNATGSKLQEKQVAQIKAKFGTLFSPKILNTVIKKFANTGEYNMYAIEIGCAMAITYLVYKNDLAELNYVPRDILTRNRCARLTPASHGINLWAKPKKLKEFQEKKFVDDYMKKMEQALKDRK